MFIQIPHLDLSETYNSGQHLRWIRCSDNRFVVIHGNKCVRVTQSKDRFHFDCAEDVFYDVWYNYFDINTDYLRYNFMIKKADDDFIREASVRGSGIRIIKRDMFEVIITSLVDDFFEGDVEYTDILIDSICSSFGKKHTSTIREIGKLFWFEFPSTHDFIKHKDELKTMVATDLYNKIISVCEFINNYGGKKLPEHMRKIGVNDYTFGCINLYGRHKLNRLPINENLVHIIECDIGCEEVEDFFDMYIHDCGLDCICGLVGRYIYYHSAHPPKQLLY